jgi:HK97 family phage prohead protease
MEKKVRKLLSSEILKADTSLAEKRQIRVTAASGRADRVGDIVKVEGIDLSNYKKNAVVLYGHDHYGLPIAKAVDMQVVNGKLEMTFEFADAETYAFADTVYKLVKGGFLKGVSIGARVLEAEYLRDDDERIIGRLYKKLELLEVSVVAIPADSKALITAVKSGAVSEAEFEEYMSKSFEATLDMPTENNVQVNTVGSSPEEDEAAMKEEIAALAKRIEALETLLKAQTTVSETAAKSMEAIQGMVTTLQAQMTKSSPNVSEIAAQAANIPGPAGDIAKQVFGLLEQMTKKVK